MHWALRYTKKNAIRLKVNKNFLILQSHALQAAPPFSDMPEQSASYTKDKQYAVCLLL
jgi:hypothetical protein